MSKLTTLIRNLSAELFLQNYYKDHDIAFPRNETDFLCIFTIFF